MTIVVASDGMHTHLGKVREVLAKCEKAFKEFGTWGSGTKDDGNGGAVTSKAGEKKLPALIETRDSLKQKQKEFQHATRLPVMQSASSRSAAAAPLQLAAGGPTPRPPDSEALAAAFTEQLLSRLHLPPPAATLGTPQQPAVDGRNVTLVDAEMEAAKVPCMPCHEQSHKVYESGKCKVCKQEIMWVCATGRRRSISLKLRKLCIRLDCRLKLRSRS